MAEPAEADLRTGQDPLGPDELDRLDAWWRAANYLSVGQIYLLDNPLLRQHMADERLRLRAYARQVGDDAPEVTDWVWPGSVPPAQAATDAQRGQPA